MSRRVLASTIALAVGAAAVVLFAIGGRESPKAPTQPTPVAASKADSRPVEAAPSTVGSPPAVLPPTERVGKVPSQSLPDEPRKRGRVAGWVVDSEADAIAGARIRVAVDPAGGGEDFEPKTLTTDDTGAFRLEGLGEGPFILVARAEGRRTAILRDVRPGAGAFEIVLPRLTGIAGRVLESGTGAPVKRFTAKLVGFNAMIARDLGWTGPTRSFESEDGSFAITDLAALPLELGFEFEFGAVGFVPARIEVETLAEGELRGDFEVRLRRGLSVSGTVVDGASGTPVSRAHVFYSLLDEPERIVTAEPTGREGSFTIDGFWRGARLRVRHMDFADATTEALGMAGEEALSGLVIRLSRGGAIDGYARSTDGSPYAWGEAHVWLDEFISDTAIPFRKTAPIDRSGYFVIRGLGPGVHHVTAHPARIPPKVRDPSSPELSAYVAVEDGETTRVEFGAPPAGGCTVRGRVLWGDEPVRGARVRIEPGSENAGGGPGGRDLYLSERTAEDGSYLIEHVPPGEARILVEKEDLGLAEVGAFSIQVPASEELEVDVRLSGGGIRGTVTRASDRAPVPGAAVSVYPEGRAGRRFKPSPWVRCDAAGRYRVRGLEAGSYSVAVDPPSDHQREGRRDPLLGSLTEKRREGIEVGEGEAVTVDFALESGGTALVRVIDPSGSPMPGEEVSLHPEWEEVRRLGSSKEGFTDGAGVARIPGVVPGRYSASIESREYASQSSPVVAVRAGEEAEVRLELKVPFALRVRVLDTDGRPVPEARGLIEGEREDEGVEPSSAEDKWEGVLTAYLVAGEYDLRVRAKGFWPSRTTVRVGPTAPKEVVVRLERNHRPK